MKLFTCECGYQGHVINAQSSVYLSMSVFFQCLFKASSFVVNLHKRSSPSCTSTINYFQNRPQMFVQIHHRTPMPTLLCNAKYFLFCGKHLKCSNGQHITAYCLTKVMMQTKCIAIFFVSHHATFYIPTHHVSTPKGNN
jgi:hypothetical protein